ncbi:hypothetical protein CEXT_74521 [Caerostris extrusa]|uniref:Uncharacterized protein n=1 Tax=Caerostris extrusa TaxID=172846 RepID=A0AAV4T7J6_CAEEX|nr:hypothetical protein CEXT_74521 [Caerostris extrusa]
MAISTLTGTRFQLFGQWAPHVTARGLHPLSVFVNKGRQKQTDSCRICTADKAPRRIITLSFAQISSGKQFSCQKIAQRAIGIKRKEDGSRELARRSADSAPPADKEVYNPSTTVSPTTHNHFYEGFLFPLYLRSSHKA